MALKMAITNYYSIGESILGERQLARERTNYVLDAVGSVTGTLVSGVINKVYMYKPYGAELSSSGAGSDTAFRWIGSLGYRNMERMFTEVYVRARTYSTSCHRWITRDILWPTENGFGYARGCPSTLVDRSGNATPFVVQYPALSECGVMAVEWIEGYIAASSTSTLWLVQELTMLTDGTFKQAPGSAHASLHRWEAFPMEHVGSNFVTNDAWLIGSCRHGLTDCKGRASITADIWFVEKSELDRWVNDSGACKPHKYELVWLGVEGLKCRTLEPTKPKMMTRWFDRSWNCTSTGTAKDNWMHMYIDGVQLTTTKRASSAGHKG